MQNAYSPLIEAIVFQSTLCLQINMEENFGVIDYERFQEDLACHLKSIEKMEDEVDALVYELQAEIALSNSKDNLIRERNEEVRALKSLCKELQGGNVVPEFCRDHLN